MKKLNSASAGLLARLCRGEAGQNAFEYMLVLGGVVAAVVAALLTFDVLIAEFVGHVCPGVDTANGLSAVGDCINGS